MAGNNARENNHHLISHRKLHIKGHLIIGGMLLLLAFIGVVLTDWQSQYAHDYWDGLAVIFAISSLTLSWLASRHQEKRSYTQLWREFLHWGTLIAFVYLVGILKHMGFFSAEIASMVVLILLSLTTILAGVHFDCMFIILGIFLGIMAVLSVFVEQYLSLIAIPISLILLVIMGWHLHRKSHVKCEKSETTADVS